MRRSFRIYFTFRGGLCQVWLPCFDGAWNSRMTDAAPRILLHAFSTFKLGGSQARFVQLANAFGARYRHLVMAMDDNYKAGERLDRSVIWQPLRLPVRRGGMLANRAAFRIDLQARRPDLLATYNWGAIEWVAANLPGCVPHVHVEDGFGPEEVRGQLPRRVWARRILLRLARTPVIVASRNLERIAVDSWKLPPQRVKFIANGVAVQGRASPGGIGLTIGTVAALRAEKNVARLIRAFAVVRARQTARLVIVGDGPERVSLAALALELGVAADVEFAGYQKNPLDWLRGFDLFALSSDTEQLPISMLEAMACGVPVIATCVGDVPDIMPAIARAALAPADDAKFAATLLRVIDTRADWPAWIDAGVERVHQSYTPEAMLAQWERVFEGDFAWGKVRSEFGKKIAVPDHPEGYQ